MHKIWAGMEAIYKKGLAKSIGISNFNIQITLDLLTYAEIKPATNQIELHPYLPQINAVNWFKKMGIQVVAYSPLYAPANPGHRSEGNEKKDLLNEPVVKELAEKYKKSAGQIVLNWSLQRGHVIIPKSSNKGRQLQNLETYKFKLEKEEIDKISALACGERVIDISNFPGFGGVPAFD